MEDVYVYPGTNVLKNKFNILDYDKLQEKELNFFSISYRKLEKEDLFIFNKQTLLDIHKYLFQDIYEWAGEVRVINIIKYEPILKGFSIEYTDCNKILDELNLKLEKINSYNWELMDFNQKVKCFSRSLAEIWKVHPFREGNTRTIVAFFNKFAEYHNIPLDRSLFRKYSDYFRNALVAANANTKEIGDKADISYLEKIVADSMRTGLDKQVNIEI